MSSSTTLCIPLSEQRCTLAASCFTLFVGQEKWLGYMCIKEIIQYGWVSQLTVIGTVASKTQSKGGEGVKVNKKSRIKDKRWNDCALASLYVRMVCLDTYLVLLVRGVAVYSSSTNYISCCCVSYVQNAVQISNESNQMKFATEKRVCVKNPILIRRIV